MTTSADRSPVLVTGGAGWLGVRLVRVLASSGRNVRVLVRSESAEVRLRTAGLPLARVETVHGDITDLAALERATAGVRLVFHLAAEKQVDRSERDAWPAIRTNVVGSRLLLEAARANGVETIVAASSEKACEPTGVLGMTKSLMERIVVGSEGPSWGIALRLGGILESAGSVLERWRETVRTDRAICITDPEMTRFVMTADEAVAALLHVAVSAESQIVAPALSAYRLGDLATAFARAHGGRIVTTGARSGEKLHAMLVSSDECRFARREEGFFMITPGRAQPGVEPYGSRTAPRLDQAELGRRIAAVVRAA